MSDEWEPPELTAEDLKLMWRAATEEGFGPLLYAEADEIRETLEELSRLYQQNIRLLAYGKRARGRGR